MLGLHGIYSLLAKQPCDSSPSKSAPVTSTIFCVWASYFKSRFICLNAVQIGGFFIKMTKREACKPKIRIPDDRLRILRATSTPGRLEEGQKFCGNFTKTVIVDVSAVPGYLMLRRLVRQTSFQKLARHILACLQGREPSLHVDSIAQSPRPIQRSKELG